MDGETKGAVVCVRFSASQAKALDAARGAMDRSTFVRQAVNSASKGGRK